MHWPQRGARILAGMSALLIMTFAPVPSRADTAADTRETIKVVTDDSGSRLQVDGRDFLVRGMNWDYVPIGQNYAYDLFQQPDDFVRAALDREMSLLAGMNVNAIRIYAGIPPRWVKYIHDKYGIFCIINHTVGRYGFTLDGVWNKDTDYSNVHMRAALAADVAATVAKYKGTPGVLMYLLGNENNYGLSWSSFEIEALPKGEQNTARARFLYSLYDEIARATKAQDPGIPVAIANGDLQYVDLIASECRSIDILGTNVYRGISSGDLFKVVHDKLGIPVMYTEFGSDAFNARDHREDQAMQAKYLIGLWREIYEKTAGHGQEGNAIGGCVFQWSDGWWKYKQEERLDIHDANASWPDGGYADDYVKGENNMNEEWWGICAKGAPDSRGLFEEYPRAAYYALQKVFTLDPYAPGTGNDVIARHFAGITPGVASLQARGDRAALAVNTLEKVRVSGIRAAFETIQTGGNLTTTPERANALLAPAYRGYGTFQSYYTDFTATPDPSITAKLSVNLHGDVPTNPIDQIFYENRGTDRVRVYQASISWDDRWFTADAYYRTGHYHWGYEGDFFGLYREANYGPNLDLYDGRAPIGVEMAAKRQLNGLKLAWGPALWWGATPMVMAKYRHQVGRFDATAVYEKDIPALGSGALDAISLVGSSVVVNKPTSKATLHLKTQRGPFTVEGGGIWAGANQVDAPFMVAEQRSTGWVALRDHVHAGDTFGGKFRVTAARGRLQWYAQGASMGLVADAGPTGTTQVTGWNLKDTGSGNQRNLISGFAYNSGKFQFGPNVLWQKPIVGPIPALAIPPARPRDIAEDPFAVRANREMTAAEFLISYDPTPATWLYAWDNDVREDARLAGSLGFVYRHMPTNMDAAIGFLSDGVTPFAFAGSTPPRDLWEVNARAVSRVSANVRMVSHGYYGTGEPNSTNDPRLVTRWGADVRVVTASATVAAYAKFNDWGPYDYHKDFNLTYPVQLMGEISHSLGAPQWFDTNPSTRIGVRAIWRSLDQYSPRFTGIAGDPNGSEWEVRTYLRFWM
jgi:hypothetical protein